MIKHYYFSKKLYLFQIHSILHFFNALRITLIKKMNLTYYKRKLKERNKKKTKKFKMQGYK